MPLRGSALSPTGERLALALPLVVLALTAGSVHVRRASVNSAVVHGTESSPAFPGVRHSPPCARTEKLRPPVSSLAMIAALPPLGEGARTRPDIGEPRAPSRLPEPKPSGAELGTAAPGATCDSAPAPSP